MKHFATPRFWELYSELPTEIKSLSDRCFKLLNNEPSHPSLHFKKVGKFYSARVGLSFRVLAVKDGDDFVWVWIGNHDDYDFLIK